MAWNYLTLKSSLAKRLVGYLFLTASFLVYIFFCNKNNKKKISSILMIKLDHIGDVLLATPVLENLRKQFPQAHIAMMVGCWAKPIVEDNPYLDEVIVYDSTFYNRKGRVNSDVISNIKKIWFLRKKGFDLIVDLRPSPGTLLLAILNCGKYRIDIGTSAVKKKIRGLFSAKNRHQDAVVRHEVERNIQVLRDFGLKSESYAPLLKISEGNKIYAELILRKSGIVLSDFIVAFLPGAGWKYRNYKTDRFAKIGNWLSREYGVKVLILGGPGDNNLAYQIYSQMEVKPINLVGQTTVGQLAAVLKNCNLFVGSDSGPMHIAAAVGTYVVALFGPQSPQRFAPYSDRCVVLRADVPCSPCEQVECKRPDDTCMDRISAEEVIHVIKNIGDFSKVFKGKDENRFAMLS